MTCRAGHGFSGPGTGDDCLNDDDDVLARLELALDRIEARPPALPLLAEPGLAESELAERLDTLMTQLRDALAHPPQ